MRVTILVIEGEVCGKDLGDSESCTCTMITMCILQESLDYLGTYGRYNFSFRKLKYEMEAKKLQTT